MSSTSSSSTQTPSIVFSLATKKDMASEMRCTISNTSSFKISQSKRRPNVNHPCIAKLNGKNIILHWGVLQLIKQFGLTYQNWKVEIDFPERSFTQPSEVSAFVRQVSKVCFKTFSLTTGMIRVLQDCPTNLGYVFFDKNRNTDAVALFKKIIELSDHQSVLGKRPLEESSSSIPSLKRKKITSKPENSPKVTIQFNELQQTLSMQTELNVKKILDLIPRKTIKQYLRSAKD